VWQYFKHIFSAIIEFQLRRLSGDKTAAYKSCKVGLRVVNNSSEKEVLASIKVE